MLNNIRSVLFIAILAALFFTKGKPDAFHLDPKNPLSLLFGAVLLLTFIALLVANLLQGMKFKPSSLFGKKPKE